MKTAEEWKTELFNNGDMTCIATVENIKAIQLDALQQGRIEGAKWAAGKVEHQAQTCAIFADPKTATRMAANSILSSIDELKKIK